MSRADNKDDIKISDFRGVMHLVFCGKRNEDDRCPAGCPARKKNLTNKNWGKIKICDILEVKK